MSYKSKRTCLKWIGFILLLSLIFTSLLTGCKGKTADTRIVQVAETQGTVSLLKEGSTKEIQAVKGMNLAQKDTMITGVKGRSVLNIDNDKTVDIWGNVRMTVDQIVGTLDGKDGQSHLNVSTGKVFVRIRRALQPGEVFEVETPTCVMGVRGTQFYVGVQGNNTEIAVLDGSVVGSLTKDIKDEAFKITANQQVKLNRKITKPEQVEVKPLKQKDLPLFVLEAIKAEPKDIDPAFLENIDQVIEEKRNTPEFIASGQLETNPWNGHQYMRVDGPINDPAAHLVTISDEKEQQYVAWLLQGAYKKAYMIGLMRAKGTDNAWNWINGEPLGYSNWAPGQPNASGMSSARAVMDNYDNKGMWRNIDPNGNESYGYIYEWDEPVQDLKAQDPATKDPEVAAVSLNNYERIVLNDKIESVIAFMGEGKTGSEQDGTDVAGSMSWVDKGFGITVYYDDQNDIIAKSNTGLPTPVCKLNLSDKALQDSVKEGMAQEQVFRILGRDFEAQLSKVKGTDVIIYTFTWKDRTGKSISVDVQDGVVTQKYIDLY